MASRVTSEYPFKHVSLKHKSCSGYASSMPDTSLPTRSTGSTIPGCSLRRISLNATCFCHGMVWSRSVGSRLTPSVQNASCGPGKGLHRGATSPAAACSSVGKTSTSSAYCVLVNPPAAWVRTCAHACGCASRQSDSPGFGSANGCGPGEHLNRGVKADLAAFLARGRRNEQEHNLQLSETLRWRPTAVTGTMARARRLLHRGDARDVDQKGDAVVQLEKVVPTRIARTPSQQQELSVVWVNV